jgi:hypothetical protein
MRRNILLAATLVVFVITININLSASNFILYAYATNSSFIPESPRGTANQTGEIGSSSSTIMSFEICNNGIDDNNNGRIDEPGCILIEICNNNRDDDNNGRIDEPGCIVIDIDLGADGSSATEMIEICLNGIDEDGDGETDEVLGCVAPALLFEFCDDNRDNNNNGLVDSEEICFRVEICDNDINDDADNVTDEAYSCIEIDTNVRRPIDLGAVPSSAICVGGFRCGEWLIVANGLLGNLSISSVDDEGKLNGTIFDRPIINGSWDQASKKITFSQRITTGFDNKTIFYRYDGFLTTFCDDSPLEREFFSCAHILAGSATPQTSSAAQQFGWLALRYTYGHFVS